MEGSSAPAIGSRRFAARANRESAAQLGIRAAERREHELRSVGVPFDRISPKGANKKDSKRFSDLTRGFYIPMIHWSAFCRVFVK